MLRRFARPEHITAKEPQPALLSIHGGGFVSENVDICAGLFSQMVIGADRPVFAVDYRLAPEHPYPAAIEDSFAALYAGAGVAVSLALMARDKELSPPIAKLVLMHPMLNDRTRYPEDAEFLKFATWSPKHNKLAWAAYLGEDKAGEPEVEAGDFKELPSTYIDIGTLDVFRDENLEFVKRLLADNVEVEFHLWPGVPHVFEFLGAGTKWHRRATETRNDALKEF
ncbi:hypothetical protein FZEAL_2101 [Fusarium zealandicum]|uniref:Alpha/beta hydrolase fold-3 domain-containing protein n=1 Tax=Fusarium zealandicum TaxID=1053134 RepID=A0A8H4XNW3_9HYPO|nr:hypothetical protein FZEAL_2101 [Fusarium zealandicum]